MKTIKIDGKDVPVIPAKATEVISNKRTGKQYKDQAAFDADVNDPSTDTTSADFKKDVAITVASLEIFGKTK